MSNTFSSLGLSAELVQAVTELGYEQPTPIQTEAIPMLLAGRDVLGQAQTGTGKTAAFALPMLALLNNQQHAPQGLVLAPTRELAIQVAEAIYRYGRTYNVRVLPIYGGTAYSRQIKRLNDGVHVVVGTPGRIIDLIQKRALDLSHVRSVVLDEADEMLKMGFLDDVETILRETPAERQTALFSATLSEPIRRLAERYMRNPHTITVAHKTMTVAQTEQRYYLVDESSKPAALSRLLEVEDVTSALIFARTKVGASKLADTLMARGYPVEALHGDMSQEARETVLRRFRSGRVHILVATDVMARGLDIESVSHVINFDMPYDAEDYVHRIGRTGRAGRDGLAVTMAEFRDRRKIGDIEAYTQQRLKAEVIPGLEPKERFPSFDRPAPGRGRGGDRFGDRRPSGGQGRPGGPGRGFSSFGRTDNRAPAGAAPRGRDTGARDGGRDAGRFAGREGGNRDGGRDTGRGGFGGRNDNGGRRFSR